MFYRHVLTVSTSETEQFLYNAGEQFREQRAERLHSTLLQTRHQQLPLTKDVRELALSYYAGYTGQDTDWCNGYAKRSPNTITKALTAN